MKRNTRLAQLNQACIKTVLLSFLYAFMTWLFFVTKPSFMDLLTFLEKLSVFFTTGLSLSVIGLLFLGLIFLFDFSLSPVLSPFPKFFYTLPAGVLISSLGLIMLDNFTYTVFGFGVVTSNTLTRLLYALGYVMLFVFAIYYLSSLNSKKIDYRVTQLGQVSSGSLLIIAVILAALSFQPLSVEESQLFIRESNAPKPNIILISNDGLNAENMSVYGYERKTTPFMEELGETSLLMLNNFANANVSTGSDTSLLTGKSPFETGVLYPPNTLQEKDMYEHLPGLLRQNGYRTISLGVPHFLDMNVINFKNAFESVNCQANEANLLVREAAQTGYSNTLYFLSTISGRLVNRLKHIFFIEEMENPYSVVAENKPIRGPMNEEEVFNCLADEINQARLLGQPFFAHIHLVSTHGEIFRPAVRVFSKGQEQDQNWMTDFYDDAILSYDYKIKDLVDYLVSEGLFDNTILVLYSDHGSQWTIKDRTPLMIYFPGGLHAGVVTENTQNLDIAPTLIDFLGLSKPTWMWGESLITALEPTRLIYAAEIKFDFFHRGRIVPDNIQPPFYQFGMLDVMQCQRFYQIDLQSMTMTVDEIEQYWNPCPVESLASEGVIWASAGEMLRGLGYDLPEGWGRD